jgi:uncharacterized protein
MVSTQSCRSLVRDARRLTGAALLALMVVQPALAAARPGPSFDCKKVARPSIPARICDDPALAQLDRQLAAVYRAALPKARNEKPPMLRAEQFGWTRGRDECWKAQDRERDCIEDQYRRRIAYLQARYRLLEPTATLHLACDGDPRNEVWLRRFPTTPPTIDAERGDLVAFFYPETRADGVLYVARNERLREGQGEFSIQWGFEAPWMRCVAQR